MVEFDYPVSYSFRRYEAALNGEDLPPLSPPEDDRIATLQEKVRELERELAGKKVVYRSLKTITQKSSSGKLEGIKL